MIYEDLEKIAASHGAPFYLFDREAFTRNFQDIRTAFTRHYPRVLIGYSYKTNYIPFVCRIAGDLGAYAEVVSRLELDLALRIGCEPARIIFNGPVKSRSDIELALGTGMLLNIDSFAELELVEKYALRHPDAAVCIGLRVNMTLTDEEEKSHIQEGLPTGRFGFSQEGLAEAALRLRRLGNVRVNSLHGHTSSTSRSLWVYQTITRTLAEAAARHFPESIDYLNVGGGFFGRRVPAMGLTDTPTYADYAATVGAELSRHPWVEARRPHLVIEPGMAVVADTLSFFTRVFTVKKIGGRRLAVVDGSIFNVKPTMHRRNHPFAVIKKNGGSGRRERYDVVGATCMEKDCLLQEVDCEEIEEGDFIRLDNVGAYTVVMTPPFIHPAPAIVMRDGSVDTIVRRRQTFDDVFAGYLI